MGFRLVTSPPEPCAVVRFHSGVPQSETDADLFCVFFIFPGAVKPCAFGCNIILPCAFNKKSAANCSRSDIQTLYSYFLIEPTEKCTR